MTVKYDFEGWVTKNDIKCSDGRTIRHDAFIKNDGSRVPLVFQHNHSDINSVVGFIDLSAKDEGMWGRGSMNSTPQGKVAKELVQHGDITSLSIYANQLSERDGNVYHGNIREVSLVLAGANPGATIDPISIAHADGSYEFVDDEAMIHTDLTIEAIDDVIEHADEPQASSQNGSSDTKSDTKDSATVADVWGQFTDTQKNLVLSVIADNTSADIADVAKGFAGSLPVPSNISVVPPEEAEKVFDAMTDDQKKVAGYVIDSILKSIEKVTNDGESKTSDSVQHSAIEGDNMLKRNVFDDVAESDETVLSHSAMNEFLEAGERKHVASMRDFLRSGEYTFVDKNGDALQHSITDIDTLFPDAKTLDSSPAMITRDQAWVGAFLDATRKSPFSNIKSIAANLTADEARAKGYIKGNKKIDEVFPLLKRSTTATTVYKHQTLDRDDLIDITDFDVIVWLKQEMNVMLREEVARAAFVGDGRQPSAQDKIDETKIRPMFTDEDTYTIHYEVGDEAATDDGLVDDTVRARRDYKGSGDPVFYATNDVITMLLLVRDKMGHRLYANENDLAAAMRVSKIVEVPVMAGATRKAGSKTMGLLGIIVNPRDYTFGANKGGEVSFFDDFDLDFNQYKYLLETRTCGCLTVPYSAISLEYDTAKYTLTNGVLTKKGGA